MRNKIVLTILILALINLSFTFAFSDEIKKVKPVKMKLVGIEDFETSIIYFGQQGVIIWKSTLSFDPSKIDKYADYCNYNDIEYIKTDGKINFIPMIVGGALFFSGAFGADGYLGSKDMDTNLILFFSVIFSSIALTLTSLFVPRTYSPTSKSKSFTFPNEHYLFNEDDEIPTELVDFISKYE
ncbi:MAG: hypothetical protein APR63_08910 [Desulfuromonas sp. SDB]|nr:MAG: hypothetical protein APR63_08910 [Desulfuromonas sp. SDB]